MKQNSVYDPSHRSPFISTLDDFTDFHHTLQPATDKLNTEHCE